MFGGALCQRGAPRGFSRRKSGRRCVPSSFLQPLPLSKTKKVVVLRYFDYVFTGVFTFEMVIKVSVGRVRRAGGAPGAP